ncbi:hypothetical protein [Burkholderia aenigmatica]|uniref:hypothetical protein n=1 Tax=Burkholderia aenigmatica TaxID=2015348 RepID=UPI002654A36C|nr:hypothetical protein [Burkholderia aenigmatica]MDN7880099.1 hypothetical protein [Burkholderia aenigmatica]
MEQVSAAAPRKCYGALSEPQIFTVHCFEPRDDGNYRLNVHYVAGFDSEDAELRILKSDAAFLKGSRFINTDEFMYDHPQPTRLFATRMRNEDSVSREDFKAWVRASTQASKSDGQNHPATFRAF